MPPPSRAVSVRDLLVQRPEDQQIGDTHRSRRATADEKTAAEAGPGRAAGVAPQDSRFVHALAPDPRLFRQFESDRGQKPADPRRVVGFTLKFAHSTIAGALAAQPRDTTRTSNTAGSA